FYQTPTARGILPRAVDSPMSKSLTGHSAAGTAGAVGAAGATGAAGAAGAHGWRGAIRPIVTVSQCGTPTDPIPQASYGTIRVLVTLTVTVLHSGTHFQVVHGVMTVLVSVL